MNYIFPEESALWKKMDELRNFTENMNQGHYCKLRESRILVFWRHKFNYDVVFMSSQ